MALASPQITWLSQVSTNHHPATIWAPEGVEVKAYQRLMSAKPMLCHLRLRHARGHVSDRQPHSHASAPGTNTAVQEYLERFGSHRAQEALDDKAAGYFTAVMADAAHT
ncbi:hypothetical protein ACIQVA_38010 [Streptomyces microflavus]|uniref:hypothetical protein n=1 Tax=Streptomyces microflavus TaxID=1919 RepID=UPI00381AADFA